jgi:glycosyltransferase involved in cell wall biosynthesis
MVLVASNHMRKELQNNGAYPEKLEVLSLPNTQRIPGTAPPAPRTHKGRILFVGRLTDVKGTRVLIEAIRLAEAALNHPLKLEIAGEGSERADLEQFAARTGVAAEFLGFLDSKAMHDAMSDADLLGVPSLWPEPFGLVGIEAGSLGLPAVGFAVGGIEEWLIPGKSGEVAPGDPPAAQGLADAIVRAFADPDHYNLLRRGAWDVSTQFTMDRHLDRLDDIWRLATAGVNEDNFHAAQAGEHYSM